eukprot:1141651-Pelagomonas_calceolata.AAC.6
MEGTGGLEDVAGDTLRTEDKTSCDTGAIKFTLMPLLQSRKTQHRKSSKERGLPIENNLCSSACCKKAGICLH